MMELFLQTHLTKEAKEQYWNGLIDDPRRLEFCTGRSKQIATEYSARMIEKYGEDLVQHPTGDIDCWHGSTGEGRQLYGVGSANFHYVVTGSESSGSTSARCQHSQEEIQQQIDERVEQRMEEIQRRMEEKQQKMEEEMQRKMETFFNKFANGIVRLCSNKIPSDKFFRKFFNKFPTNRDPVLLRFEQSHLRTGSLFVANNPVRLGSFVNFIH